jgi:hypothetical protein
MPKVPKAAVTAVTAVPHPGAAEVRPVSPEAGNDSGKDKKQKGKEAAKGKDSKKGKKAKAEVKVSALPVPSVRFQVCRHAARHAAMPPCCHAAMLPCRHAAMPPCCPPVLCHAAVLVLVAHLSFTLCLLLCAAAV